jgi:putative glutamine amidotransferase
MGAIQGLILTGGGDVVRPGAGAAGPPKGKASRDAMRDLWEQALLKAAVGQERPIFGICRGIQVMNHYFGGTLYEHIPGELPGALAHQQREPRDVPTHPVELEPGSLVAEISGSASVMVNSGHHQAPRVPAPGFRVSGRAPDSVIEAMEHESLPFALGVQWHPEGLAAKRPEALALFKALVGRASAVRLKARGGRG